MHWAEEAELKAKKQIEQQMGEQAPGFVKFMSKADAEEALSATRQGLNGFVGTIRGKT